MHGNVKIHCCRQLLVVGAPPRLNVASLLGVTLARYFSLGDLPHRTESAKRVSRRFGEGLIDRTNLVATKRSCNTPRIEESDTRVSGAAVISRYLLRCWECWLIEHQHTQHLCAVGLAEGRQRILEFPLVEVFCPN